MPERGAADRLVVIGASAGGIEAVQAVLGALPEELPAAVAIAVHVSPTSPGLASILDRAGTIEVSEAVDGAVLRAGCAVVAPPDRHLVVRDGRMHVTTGPRENGFRPAVDTLFRSAARGFGPRTVGVILTGMLDDGAFGLRTIASAGGVGLVQDPAGALYRDMPAAAIAAGGATEVHPLAELGAAIAAAVDHVSPQEGTMSTAVRDDDMEPHVDSSQIDGELVPIVCPSCGGNLWEQGGGDAPVQYRCRTGHRFSPESLTDIQGTEVEDALWGAYRALLERAETTRRLADRFADQGLDRSQRRWLDIADEAQRRAKVLRQLLDSA